MKSFHTFTPHHLPLAAEHLVGNGQMGRFFFLPGSDGRARRMGERFTDLKVLPSDRQHNVYLGTLPAREGMPAVDVGAVASGMGCPSLDIIATELIALGGRRFLRVGTAGSMIPRVIRAGDLVIATAAVRDEAVSDLYIDRGYPAVAHQDMVMALTLAARSLGLGKRTYPGVIHSKDGLFAREFGFGPSKEENRRFMERLYEMGVLASEMEAAHLFVLSHAYSDEPAPLEREGEQPDGTIKSGALMAIIGDDRPFAPKELVAQVESEAIDVALRCAAELLHIESSVGQG